MTNGPVGKAQAWFRLARLQFYPMVLIAYGAGAAMASLSTGAFSWTLFLLGYACLFFIELATVFTNELLDYDSDRVNRNASPFTGGSRMIVEGALAPGEVRRGIAVALVVLAVIVATLLITAPAAGRPPLAVALAIGVVLGVEYTARPLRLSYNGLGELDVAFTHSTYVILVGYIVQGGAWTDPTPYLVSVPAFLSVLSANTLAGIPDTVADHSVGKRSYSVLMGPRAAALIAATAALAAAAFGLWLWNEGIVGGKIGAMFWVTVPHAIALGVVLVGFIRSGSYDRRIDKIMINALNFIVWFGLIPLVYFLWQLRST